MYDKLYSDIRVSITRDLLLGNGYLNTLAIHKDVKSYSLCRNGFVVGNIFILKGLKKKSTRMGSYHALGQGDPAPPINHYIKPHYKCL